MSREEVLLIKNACDCVIGHSSRKRRNEILQLRAINTLLLFALKRLTEAVRPFAPEDPSFEELDQLIADAEKMQ